jgi:hypothetical protein
MITEESPLRGKSDFKELRSSKYIYVDKTKYIVNMLNTDNKCFIARPRRFGKTLMLNTIKYLYLGDHELFEGLEIYEYIDRPIFRPHPVIHLDMSDVKTHAFPDDLVLDPNERVLYSIDKSLLRILNTIALSFGVAISQISASDAFRDLICNTSTKCGKVVILIDEYDYLLTNAFDKPILQKDIHEFLREFYGSIKTLDSNIHIAYITGISKFSKVGVFSFLNNVTDFSNDIAYSDMFGYTNDELCRYFKSFIDETADRMQLQPEALIDKLKSYYDGYSFAGEQTVYNPVSIRYFFTDKEFDDYWTLVGDFSGGGRAGTLQATPHPRKPLIL